MNNFTVSNSTLVHLTLKAEWQSGQGRHTEILHCERFNVWRDIDLLPLRMQEGLLGRRAGESVVVTNVLAGELVEPYQSHRVHSLKRSDSLLSTAGGQKLRPEFGRFYPQGLLKGVPYIPAGSNQPLRVIALDDEQITLDLNHPMATYGLSFCAKVEEILPAPAENGGNSQDILADLMSGPGMQVRYADQPTCFLNEAALSRLDNSPDQHFYGVSRILQHLDARCLRELESLYGRVLKGEGRVLDLMASWDSHLPGDLSLDQLVGLGMNREELDANPRLSERLVFDLNSAQPLPFADASFDAVICSVSVEYLIDPLRTFAEVQRILAPGGRFVVSFSNRWFPTKAIALWCNLHEFERMGLVSEYFLQSGGWADLHTYSQRGLSRPQDDPHYTKSKFSDPLYAVWASKAER